MREITLVWMYHNIMDLYGDKGNVLVLKQRCLKRNIKLNIVKVNVNEDYDFNNADILFIGGGADLEQSVMYNDLLSRKDKIVKAVDNGMLVLLICGGYQLFGKYYEDRDGKRLEGLGILEYYTKADGNKRAIGNIVVDMEIEDQTIRLCGFENHGGMTYDISKPLGKVIYGNGNDGNGYEGYFDGQIIGTYMHGPLLPKNIEIADYLIKKALIKRGLDASLEKLDDELSYKARDYMLKRILK